MNTEEKIQGAWNSDESHGGHDHTEHHRMMIRDFRKRFFITLILTVPILVLSPLIQELLGYTLLFPGSKYLVFALSSIVFFYGGRPFLKGLVDELKEKNPGMMTLIGLAIMVAYVYSGAVTFGLEGRPFYWELATLIGVMLAGHWIEMASVVGASSALEELAALMPDTAHRKDGNETEDVPVSEIGDGDILLIKPGEKIPADGEITDGTSYVNESMLTGESTPVKKGVGDTLIGGSVNGDGSLELRVDGTGDDSYLSKVINMVRDAQASKSKTQNFSDKAAFWLTIVAITAGVATLVAWLLAGRDLQFSIARMATVMVITCPHTLGLAIPLVVSVSTTKSAQNGLLIRNRTAFENARKITTLVFDKTGTLTYGTFTGTNVRPLDETTDEEKILFFAASVERNSEHPIGRGILEKAEEDGIEFVEPEEFSAIKGKGVRAVVDGKSVSVVSPGYLEENDITISGVDAARAGVTRVFLLVDETPIGLIELSDEIRSESYDAVKKLQSMGIKCRLLTGDNVATGRQVSEELGMDGYDAEVLPDQKQDIIWATGYNVVAIPLAAGVLSGVGIVLSPEVGALLMSLSTVIVAINARLLRIET